MNAVLRDDASAAPRDGLRVGETGRLVAPRLPASANKGGLPPTARMATSELDAAQVEESAADEDDDQVAADEFGQLKLARKAKDELSEVRRC